MLKTRLGFLADSVQSVGVVSELTTLQTVPPQEAPEAQAVAPEPQFQPDQSTAWSGSQRPVSSAV